MCSRFLGDGPVLQQWRQDIFVGCFWKLEVQLIVSRNHVTRPTDGVKSKVLELRILINY